MTRPQAVPDEAAHHRRLTVREMGATFGRELLGTLLALAGLAGIGITLTLLAGLLVMLLVISCATLALGVFLLFRPDPYDPRFPPR